MAVDYNSRLISALYSAKDDDEAISVLDEMEEIKDPIFLRPIYDAYKKFKRTSFGHYFLYAISQIKTPEALKIAQELASRINENYEHFDWIIKIINSHDYHDDSLTELVENYLEAISYEDKRVSPILVDDIIHYLKDRLTNERNKSALRRIIFETKYKRDTKAAVLRHLLKSDARNELDNFIEAYGQIQDSEIEIMIAQEFVWHGWYGDRVNTLKTMIMEKGGSRAKEILIKAEEEKNKKAEAKKVAAEERAAFEYANSQIVNEIRFRRKSINNKLISDQRFGYALFPEDESLMDHAAIVKEKSHLIERAMQLRSLISEMTPGEHNYAEEDQQKYLPQGTNVTDFGKPLNKLYLCMKQRGLVIDGNIYGLRHLNAILSQIAHPGGADEKLIERLSQEKLLSFYNNGDWAALHKAFLDRYLAFLVELEAKL